MHYAHLVTRGPVMHTEQSIKSLHCNACQTKRVCTDHIAAAQPVCRTRYGYKKLSCIPNGFKAVGPVPLLLSILVQWKRRTKADIAEAVEHRDGEINMLPLSVLATCELTGRALDTLHNIQQRHWDYLCIVCSCLIYKISFIIHLLVPVSKMLHRTGKYVSQEVA